jgi:hypothetical protein
MSVVYLTILFWYNVKLVVAVLNYAPCQKTNDGVQV